jgi:hypothetical protein
VSSCVCLSANEQTNTGLQINSSYLTILPLNVYFISTYILGMESYEIFERERDNLINQIAQVSNGLL